MTDPGLMPRPCPAFHHLQYGKVGRAQGARTSSKNHVKKSHSILRYTKSSGGFTEIKQVSAHSIHVCRGSMGISAWDAFVLRVEHPYIVGSRRNPWIQVSPPSMLRELHVKVHFLALAPQITLETTQKADNKVH